MPSKAKFAATKELIDEKQYGLARLILQTIPHDPKAKQWLQRLDQIDPLPKETEKDKYYRRKNKEYKRRRFGAGLETFMAGIGLLGMFAFFVWGDLQRDDGNISLSSLELILLIGGLIMLIAGRYVMTKKD